MKKLIVLSLSICTLYPQSVEQDAAPAEAPKTPALLAAAKSETETTKELQEMIKPDIDTVAQATPSTATTEEKPAEPSATPTSPAEPATEAEKKPAESAATTEPTKELVATSTQEVKTEATQSPAAEIPAIEPVKPAESPTPVEQKTEQPATTPESTTQTGE